MLCRVWVSKNQGNLSSNLTGCRVSLEQQHCVSKHNGSAELMSVWLPLFGVRGRAFEVYDSPKQEGIRFASNRVFENLSI